MVIYCTLLKNHPHSPPEPGKNSSETNLLHLLRKLTAADHKRLDEVIIPTHVTGSVENYSAYIGGFHRATLKAMELIDWVAIEKLGLPDVAERKARYACLGMDSAALGNIKEKPNTSTHSSAENGRAGLGALYVLEGSIHGGGVLMKMLRERNMQDLPTSFLHGFGEQSHPMWGRFTRWFQDLDTSTLDLPAITAEAKKTFGIFHDQFSPTT